MAEQSSSDAASSNQAMDVLGGSPERFGFAWSIYHEILPVHQEQFLLWTSALDRNRWGGAEFLDAGCGIGRNAFWAMVEGAKSGVAIDVDERSVSIARTNLSQFPSVEVRRQSIYDIKEESTFDIVFSVGVLHHLQDPIAALRRMTQAAKPGGYVLIWVYGRQQLGWVIRFFDPARKALFSRMNVGLLHHLSLYPAIAIWAAVRAWPVRQKYLAFLRRLSFSHTRSVIYDQMIPRISHYWSRDDVESLMHAALLESVEVVNVNDISWSAIGRRSGLTG